MPSKIVGKPATLLSSSSFLYFAILAAYPPEPKRWGFSTAFIAFSFCWTLRATAFAVFF
jgi:hypothetical protein